MEAFLVQHTYQVARECHCSIAVLAIVNSLQPLKPVSLALAPSNTIIIATPIIGFIPV